MAGASEVRCPALAGKDLRYGFVIMRNHGNEPIILDTVELVDPAPEIKLVKSEAAGPRRRLDLPGGSRPILGVPCDPGWPEPVSPLTDLHELADYPVMPISTPAGKRGVELIVSLRVESPGRYRVRGLKVTYSISPSRSVGALDDLLRDLRWSATFGPKLLVCVTKKVTRSCTSDPS